MSTLMGTFAFKELTTVDKTCLYPGVATPSHSLGASVRNMGMEILAWEASLTGHLRSTHLSWYRYSVKLFQAFLSLTYFLLILSCDYHDPNECICALKKNPDVLRLGPGLNGETRCQPGCPTHRPAGPTLVLSTQHSPGWIRCDNGDCADKNISRESASSYKSWKPPVSPRTHWSSSGNLCQDWNKDVEGRGYAPSYIICCLVKLLCFFVCWSIHNCLSALLPHLLPVPCQDFLVNLILCTFPNKVITFSHKVITLN